MGWPHGRAQITSLGGSSRTNPGKVQNVTVLGSNAQVKWTQDADALHLQLPHGLPVENSYGAAVRIALS
jgi:alpha-L-fucosidase